MPIQTHPRIILGKGYHKLTLWFCEELGWFNIKQQKNEYSWRLGNVYIVGPEFGLDSLDYRIIGNRGPDNRRIGVVYSPPHPTSALHKSLGYYYLSNSWCVLPGNTQSVQVQGRFDLGLRHTWVYPKWQNFIEVPILYYHMDLLLKSFFLLVRWWWW